MVLVSKKHAFIFLKTRKTAGTSIEMLLEPYCARPGHRVTEQTKAKTSRYGVIGSRKLGTKTARWPWQTAWHNHMTAEAVRNGLGNRRWSRYRKITAVRNPFDRMVSQFCWRQKRNARLDRDALRAGFRKHVLGRWPNDYNLTHIDDNFVPDAAIRYEHLHEDIRQLADKLGLELNPDTLPITKDRKDVRRGLSVPEFYDEELIETVRKRMDWVFRHFDYADRPMVSGEIVQEAIG